LERFYVADVSRSNGTSGQGLYIVKKLLLMLVANLKSGYTVDYGMLMLGVLICTLPTAIIFLCLQKSFANGITGAVK